MGLQNIGLASCIFRYQLADLLVCLMYRYATLIINDIYNRIQDHVSAESKICIMAGFYL